MLSKKGHTIFVFSKSVTNLSLDLTFSAHRTLLKYKLNNLEQVRYIQLYFNITHLWLNYLI